jgi:hypothetical protein
VSLDGVDVNAKDGKGYTPLIVASQYGHIPLVSFLVGKFSIQSERRIQS